MIILDKREVLGEQVQTFGTIDNPLFLAKDVAKWIGYGVSNVSKMVKNVEDNERIIARINNTSAIFLTEDGLYEVLMQSRKPIAKQFKKEIKKILKQIRQTGGYIPITQEDDEKTIMAKALMISKITIEQKDALLAQREQQVQQLTYEVESKDRYLNQIAQSQNTILVRELAKVISRDKLIIGERRLWEKLRSWGLILKGKTEPSQRAVERGLFEVSESISRGSKGTFTHRTTRVTGKGQDYIIKRLLDEVEQDICI
ncbi:phage antirepressor KilAC domain-containing protein [Clostridium sp. CCUG 7971]|uniref:phage antirepressor n=1 Tax=Clostridium sp. CCUG 7971 TaxID=2811414 RepID=UPI001ABAD73D|nr:phage antirepressor KilAC domain-containing protein [Clostridium sp. CCUG 7971]MBO3446379.1 phage antirepressor KilAC domain-containing protein [Clostridium sp. CCUG 7971]